MNITFSQRRDWKNKLEYFVTPYNRALNFHKHMVFKQSIDSSKWKVLSDFVLKEKKEVLRKSLIQINKALYVEFENVAKWAMNRISAKGFHKEPIRLSKPNKADLQM